jgi:hypothetical protein
MNKTQKTQTVSVDEVLNQVSEQTGVQKYKLYRPVVFTDKTISELDIDFEGLTTADMESISSLPGCNSGDANLNEFSKTYLMHVVALASKITIHELRAFSIKDGTALTLMAQVFLVSQGLGATKA